MIHTQPNPLTAPTRGIQSEMADFMRAHPGCTEVDLAAQFTPNEIERHAPSAAALAVKASTRRIG